MKKGAKVERKGNKEGGSEKYAVAGYCPPFPLLALIYPFRPIPPTIPSFLRFCLPSLGKRMEERKKERMKE